MRPNQVDMTHCVIALLLLFVGGCVYLAISDKKLEGLSFRQKVQVPVRDLHKGLDPGLSS